VARGGELGFGLGLVVVVMVGIFVVRVPVQELLRLAHRGSGIVGGQRRGKGVQMLSASMRLGKLTTPVAANVENRLARWAVLGSRVWGCRSLNVHPSTPLQDVLGFTSITTLNFTLLPQRSLLARKGFTAQLRNSRFHPIPPLR
jgi:hypothetical protein